VKALVLLIEDNPGDVGLIRVALHEHAVECDLTVVEDGAQAIEMIQRIDDGDAPCPQFLILDLNLPKVPGMEVLKRMRASVRCSHVPVVILTSSDNLKDKDMAARLGASRYLKKPSRLNDFIALGGVFKELMNAGV
jgi:chemotaxis family two-component system response regulator Rcp1